MVTPTLLLLLAALHVSLSLYIYIYIYIIFLPFLFCITKLFGFIIYFNTCHLTYASFSFIQSHVLLIYSNSNLFRFWVKIFDHDLIFFFQVYLNRFIRVTCYSFNKVSWWKLSKCAIESNLRIQGFDWLNLELN
jgi:hypothetical protein